MSSKFRLNHWAYAIGPCHSELKGIHTSLAVPWPKTTFSSLSAASPLLRVSPFVEAECFLESVFL